MRGSSPQHLKLENIYARARDFADDLQPGAGRTFNPEWDLAYARDLARDLTRHRSKITWRARGLARDLARDLAKDLADIEALRRDVSKLGPSHGRSAATVARELVSELNRTSASRQGGAAGQQVAPSASRLLAFAAKGLPAADRARYAEEYRSELWEIACADGRRRTQLTYATRQVLAVPWLRAGLRTPRRRGATP